MTERGSLRMERWDMTQRPKAPLTHGRRGDICDVHWPFEHRDHGLEAELSAIDRNFEIIYDRATSNSDGPGHHLVRWISRGGVPSEDRFVLELSLQHDLDRQWPQGKPRAPGRWIIAAIKDRDKARRAGDEAKIEKELETERAAASDATYAAKDKGVATAEAEVRETMAPYVERGREVPVKKQGRGPKDAKIQVAMSGGGK